MNSEKPTEIVLFYIKIDNNQRIDAYPSVIINN